MVNVNVVIFFPDVLLDQGLQDEAEIRMMDGMKYKCLFVILLNIRNVEKYKGYSMECLN